MLTLKECRTVMGEDSKLYTDDEIEMIRDWMYHIADIAIETNQIEKSNTSKNSMNEA